MKKQYCCFLLGILVLLTSCADIEIEIPDDKSKLLGESSKPKLIENLTTTISLLEKNYDLTIDYEESENILALLTKSRSLQNKLILSRIKQNTEILKKCSTELKKINEKLEKEKNDLEKIVSFIQKVAPLIQKLDKLIDQAVEKIG